MMEYILVEKDTDIKANHAYFPDDVDPNEFREWLEEIDTTVYDVYQKIDVGEQLKR